MNVLKLTIVALALMTGVATANAAPQDCGTTKSLHGVWDCR
jgi:hypothetical protein